MPNATKDTPPTAAESIKKPIYRRRCAAGVVVLLIGAAVSGCTPYQPEPNDLVEEYGGSPGVYARLLAETDCAALQESFDQAANNNERANDQGDQAEADWTRGYMNTAFDRMTELGCPGGR